MRRQAPTVSISPQQLKHFAAATVAITLLLGLLAGGEDVGLAADIQAREARNQLIESETAKLGTKQLKANLKLKDSNKSKFAFAEGGEVVDMSAEWGSGGGGGGQLRPANRGLSNATADHSKLDGVPDGAKPEALRAKKNPKKTAEAKPVTEPTEQELEKAMEASRQRSGQAEASEE